MTQAKVVAIFRNIANESDPRGHFLTYFAKALCQADLANQRLLMPTAVELIRKYDIEETQTRRGILKEEQYQ